MLDRPGERPALRKTQNAGIDSFPLVRSNIEYEKLVSAFHAGVNTEVDGLKSVVSTIPNQFVYFDEPYLPIGSVGGKIVD